MPFSPLATASMKLIASPGPFGLAFSAQRDAMATLTCDPLKGRPFVTGLRVMRLSAPLGGRDAYEFQLQCGAGATAWSALGPTPLLWASAEQAEASCNRPQSASGLQVTRGRVKMGRQDHYGFTLLCGAEDNLVEVDIAGSRHVGAQEQGGKRCPEDSFLSGIEVTLALTWLGLGLGLGSGLGIGSGSGLGITLTLTLTLTLTCQWPSGPASEMGGRLTAWRARSVALTAACAMVRSTICLCTSRRRSHLVRGRVRAS